MIRELEQIKLLLENINGNLGGKTSEKHDFQKKTPSLKQSHNKELLFILAIFHTPKALILCSIFE